MAPGRSSLAGPGRPLLRHLWLRAACFSQQGARWGRPCKATRARCLLPCFPSQTAGPAMPVTCGPRSLAGALLFSALLAAAGAAGGCAELGRCCAGRSLECASAGWRPDGSYGLCYCDQACHSTLDCCSDYRHFCPEASCLVSDWSEWSGCAERCKATYRLRRRHVIQKPRNGGEACPPLEEKAGCLEYWTQQGTLCKDSILPALITTGGYGKARRKRAVLSGRQRVGYCVEFQLMAITKGCLNGNSSYTHWMKYLSEGHTVCVECQHPALDQKSLHCSGDGSGAKKNQLLHWQAVGNPRCRGTWKRVRQRDTCTCPSVHSFLFI